MSVEYDSTKYNKVIREDKYLPKFEWRIKTQIHVRNQQNTPTTTTTTTTTTTSNRHRLPHHHHLQNR